MYPVPPASHRPTNRYWFLVVCLAAMLLVVIGALRSLSNRMNSLASSTEQAQAAPKLAVTPLALVTPTESAASRPTAIPTPALTEVNPKDLYAAPASYRSRPIRVRGTVFYTGKTEDGKTWIQIVDGSSHFIDGSFAGTLPAGVAKGAEVEIIGIGAGLTTITSNGKEYDQPYIDPVQKIQLASG